MLEKEKDIEKPLYTRAIDQPVQQTFGGCVLREQDIYISLRAASLKFIMGFALYMLAHMTIAIISDYNKYEHLTSLQSLLSPVADLLAMNILAWVTFIISEVIGWTCFELRDDKNHQIGGLNEQYNLE